MSEQVNSEMFVIEIGDEETLDQYWERIAKIRAFFGPPETLTHETLAPKTLTFEEQRLIAIREAIISTALQTTTYSTPEGKGIEPLN